MTRSLLIVLKTEGKALEWQERSSTCLHGCPHTRTRACAHTHTHTHTHAHTSYMIPYQTCLSPCNRKLSWVSAYSTSGRCNPWFLLGHSSFAGFPSPPTSYIPSFSQKGTRSKWWGGLSIRIVTSKDSLDSAQALGL